MATVVCKLFNMVQPDVSVFGEKDYQQLMVIRQMVEDLCMPLEVIGIPTVREADGLAKSSRNGYLKPEERSIANCLYSALQNISAALERGEREYSRLEREAVEALQSAGFRPDYISIRRAADLVTPDKNETEWVVLGAAWLGGARLIDNLRVTRKSLD